MTVWSVLSRYQQVLIIVAIGVLGAWSVAAVISWWTGTPTYTYEVISFVVTTIVLAVVPVAERTWRHFWKWLPALNRMVFPDLHGTWTGHLHSTWIDPATGKQPSPIPTTVWVRQGLFNVSVRMKTAESRSHSTRCLLEADREAQMYRLWYSYDNRPIAEVAHRSARHEGVAWLEVDLQTSPESLFGQYFTDRRTCGDIRLTRTSPDVVSTTDPVDAR